jgi:hypothetical protein
MRRILSLRWGWALALYCVFDLVCVGMGMGVPIFNILFGFVVGWYAARRVGLGTTELQEVLRKVLIYAAIACGFTVLVMVVLWGPTVALLYDPTADLANFGIPMILYEPQASFIGWLVLMVAISPFLQFLMALLGAHLTLLRWPPRGSE